MVVVSTNDGLVDAHAEAWRERETQGWERVVRVHGWWGAVTRQGGIGILGREHGRETKKNRKHLLNYWTKTNCCPRAEPLEVQWGFKNTMRI